MAEITELELLRKIGRCINSAADNYKHRMPASCINYNALDDIESDLDAGLKAVKELFKRRNQ